MYPEYALWSMGVIAVGGVTSLFWALRHSKASQTLRKNHQQTLADLTQQQDERRKKAIEDAYREGYDKATQVAEEKHKIFSIVVRPYVKTHKEGWGPWGGCHHVQIGYQYQLMVNGIPCFNPHITIEKDEKFQETNMEAFMKTAAQITLQAVSLHAGAAAKLIQIAEEPCVERVS